MMKMLENKAIEVVEVSKLEAKVDDKTESGSEVIAKLVTLQEKNSSRFTKVIELPMETHVAVF